MLRQGEWDKILSDAGVGGLRQPAPIVPIKTSKPVPTEFRSRMVPPDTADMPVVPQQRFYDEEIRRRTSQGAPSSWWNYLAKPLVYAGRALSSGEYAVASMLRAYMKGKEMDEVGMAGLRGVAAGFTGDQEFDYTISELIENELGWDPEDTWSMENVAQEAVGLLGGILLDPLTYALSFGAGGVTKFAARDMDVIGKASRIIPAAKTVRRGAATSRKGDALIKKLTNKYLGYAGKLGASRKALGKAPAREMKYALDAGKKAQQDFIKLILSRSGGSTVDDLKGVMRWRSTADEALEVLGRKGTDANYRWLIDKGYKQLLDSAGVKFFRKTLLPFKLPGKRTEGFFGWLLAQANEKKVPLAYKVMDTPTMRKFMNFADDSYLNSVQGVKNVFSLSGKLGKEGAEIVRNALGMRGMVDDIVKRAMAGFVGVGPGQKAFKIGDKFSFNLPAETGRFLNRNEQDMVGHLLHYADHAGIEAGQLKEYITGLTESVRDAYFERGSKKIYLKDFTQDQLEDMGEAAVYVRRLMANVRNMENQLLSPGGNSIRDQYMARIFRGVRGEADIEKAIKEYGSVPFYEKSRQQVTKGQTYQGWYNNMKSGKYILETDPRKIIGARLKPSLMRAAEEDVVQKALDRGFASPQAAKLSQFLNRHPEFTKKHPYVAHALMERSTPMIHDLPEQAYRVAIKASPSEPQAFFTRLYKSAPNEVGKLVSDGKLPRNLTRGNGQYLKDYFQTYVDEFERKALRPEEIGKKSNKVYEAKLAALLMNQEKFNARVDSIVTQNWMTDAAVEVFGKEAVERGGSLEKKTKLLEEINRQAQRIGYVGDRELSSFIPAMADKISGKPGRALTEQTNETLQKIKTILSKKPSPDEVEKINLFLRPNLQQDAGQMVKHLSGISVKDPVTGATREAATYAFDEDMIKELVDVFRPGVLSSKGVNTIYHTLDRITNPLKRLFTLQQLPFVRSVPRVSFHGRNLVDLAFRSSTNLGLHNLVGGKGEWKLAAKAMAGEVGEFTIKNGDGAAYKMSFEDFRKWLSDAGFWRHEFARERFGASRMGEKSVLKELDNLVSEKVGSLQNYIRDGTRAALKSRGLKLRKGMSYLHTEKMGQAMENIFLAKNALTLLGRGHTFDDVAQRLTTHLFSYDNMTRFERGFMRRFVMFYPFTRQAVPFVIDQLKQKPYLFHALSDIREQAYQDDLEEAAVPPWVREYPMVRLERTKQNQLRMMSFRNVFTLDTIADIFPTQLHKLFGQLNPVVTAIPELMLGHDLYFNQPIGEGGKELGAENARKKLKWRKLGGFLKDSPLSDWLEYEEITYPSNNQKAITVNARKWYYLTRLHGSRLFREVNKLAETAEGDKSFGSWLLRFASGVKIYDINMERQMMFLQYDAESAHRMYERAVRRGDKKTANIILDKYRIRDGW